MATEAETLRMPRGIEPLIHDSYDGEMAGFVKGHIATDGLDIENIADELLVSTYNVVPRHTYAAKLQTGESRSQDWDYQIRTYDAPGSGRFACTVFYVAPAIKPLPSTEAAPAT